MAKKPQKQSVQKTTIYELQAEICAALAHPIRLHILDLLSNQEKNSSELLEVLQIPKANLSQHIAVLKEAGILRARKEGLFQYLSLAVPQVKEACFLVRSVLEEKIAQEEKKNSLLVRQLRAKR